MFFSETRRFSKGRQAKQAGISVLLTISAIAVAGAGFLLHVNLSTAGFLELLLVLFVSLHLGFFQVTVVSISAFLCLNFLFTEPVFTLSVTNPQDLVSLFTFEAAALLVSGLSNKVRLHAAQAEDQRARAMKLYELSRAVLLIDTRKSTSEQLAQLVQEVFEVEQVLFRVDQDRGEMPRDGTRATHAEAAPFEESELDDPAAGRSHRVLRLGTHAIGGMELRGWKIDALSADAVASIAAIAFERARAIQRENRAEVERDAERLRTAVLDGLAHGFKTPLTAIQTASSGLLAIDQLSATQTELVSIIDERATMLNQLTTRLLQTAALEAKEMRVRRTRATLPALLEKLAAEQEEEVRSRLSILSPGEVHPDQVDAALMELAVQQLLDNAAKYSAVGSPILISIRQDPEETHVVVENVTMAGCAIRVEERSKIFDRFYRGSDAARGPSGTGLGLSIVKKIAEAHGGRVWVECSEAATRFTFSIQRYEREIHG